jgi:hypothetical protein
MLPPCLGTTVGNGKGRVSGGSCERHESRSPIETATELRRRAHFEGAFGINRAQLHPGAFCPSLSLGLSNSRSTFNRPGACRKSAMKSTAGLVRFDLKSARLSLTIPGSASRPLASSKWRTIAVEPDAALHSRFSQVDRRRGQTKNSYSCHERHDTRLISLPAGGPTAIMLAASARLVLRSYFITKTLETHHFLSFR